MYSHIALSLSSISSGYTFLPFMEDDDVFHTPGDEQKPVVTELSDVAGVEPSVRNGLCRCRFVFVIAQHHIAAFYADLAFSVFVGIVDADLGLGQGQPTDS